MISEQELKKILNHIPDFVCQTNLKKLVNKITRNPLWKEFSQQEKVERLRIVLDGLNFLKLLSSSTYLEPKETVLKSSVEHLVRFLSLKPQDQDFIVMVVEIVAEFGGIQKVYKFQLVENGDINTYTAMTKTVGTTCAMGTVLVLEKKIQRKGLFGPFYEDVYRPMYDLMIKEKLVAPYQVRTLQNNFKL